MANPSKNNNGMKTGLTLALTLVLTAMAVWGALWPGTGNCRPTAEGRLTIEQMQWLRENPGTLPIWLTPEEAANRDEIGKAFRGTPPPTAPVRMPAEFEPMSGVLIRWPLGIPYALIAEISEDVEVWTIVANSSEQSQAQNAYAANSVNLANCYFLVAETNSIWTRDYGPWFIFSGDHQQGIVDHIYNRPRPYDDLIPQELGTDSGISVFGMDLVASGGNYMCDGMGVAMGTRLTYDENPLATTDAVDQMLMDYCGIHHFYQLPYVETGGIHHIDCWAKFLTPNKILVEEQTPVNAALEANTDLLATQIGSWEAPYEIVRIPVQDNEAYTNSLILNNKVLVPLFGTANDATALQVYRDAMPGYEVIGFVGSWLADDALHCRVKGIVDRYMLYIGHIPLLDTEETQSGYLVEARIRPYSGQSLVTGSPTLWHAINDGAFSGIPMAPLEGDIYRGSIPAQPLGTSLRYYIHARDASGRSENHPYVGPGGAHVFQVTIDSKQPVIFHTPIGDQAPAMWPPTVTAVVFDASGLETVKLEYRINGIDQPPLSMQPMDASAYEAEFAAPVDNNDLVEYRVCTTDMATASNSVCHPESDYHAIDIISSTPVYLWNPSSSPSVYPFSTVLNALGITYETGSSLPGSPITYGSIFALLGVYPGNHVLTNTEGEALAQYLDAGGHLYMEGADTWAYDSQTALHPYFYIVGEDDGSADCGPIYGESGTFTGDMTFAYGGSNNYMDRLSPGAGAFTVFENGDPVYDNCVAYDSGQYRTIGCAFEFGGLVDGISPNTKQELMAAYLDFFSLTAQATPEIDQVSFNSCISELCTSAMGVDAHDPEGGNLTYVWAASGSAFILGAGSDVVFDPPDTGPHPCPYQVMVTATSDVSGLSVSATVDVHVRTSGDVTGDGWVNLSDLNAIRDHFMQHGPAGWINADLNCDGWVNLNDLNLVRDHFMSSGGCTCPGP